MREWVVGLLMGCCLPMWAESDVNGDERVSVGDVVWLIDWLLNEDATNGHEYVDFGLPSGTLWAKTNVGATMNYETGVRVAWGETEEKSTYDWEGYKWAVVTDSGTTLTRYTGEMDTLRICDDAAMRLWGGLWRTPSIDQLLELMQYCRWSWALVNGMYGYRISRGANYIFLPATGYQRDNSLYEENLSGSYWAIETYASNAQMGYSLYFDDEDIMWAYRARYSGRSIRPVISPDEALRRYDVNGDGYINVTDVELLANEVTER